MGSRSQNPPRMSRARSFVFALVAGGCGSGDFDPSYASIVLELHASDGDADATFAGTVTIAARVGYGHCIEQYYREHEGEAFANEDGKAVVAEWNDRLCDDDAPAQPIDCDVVAIEQTIAGGPSRLEVTYAVTGALEGRALAVGPLPDSFGADCPGGALPGLHVGADALVGRDAGGTEIWSAQPVDDTVAVVDQDTPVVLYASRRPPP